MNRTQEEHQGDGSVAREGHRYLPEIDGLRAIAVLAVIANHVSHKVLPSGYLGVDVFFVISGYVISLSLLDRGNRPFRQILAEFYARRLRRLAPALGLAMVAGAALIQLFDPDPGRSTITGLAALFGMSNQALYLQAADYFGPNIQLNPFAHTWSLGVEEQFYFVYPTILLACIRRRGLGLSVIALLIAASALAFATRYGAHQAAVYYLLPFRFWEIGIGCLLAILEASRRSDRKSRDSMVQHASLIFLVGSLFLPASWPVVATITAVSLTAVVILSVRRGSRAYGVLTSPAAVYIGRLSYSLYLWHWIVLCLSRWTVGVRPSTLPLLLAAIGVLAALSYHLVERPLRRAQWFRRKGFTILAGLAVLGACAAVILVCQRVRWPAFSGVKDDGVMATTGVVPGYRTKISGRLVDDCALHSVQSGNETEKQKRIDRCTAFVQDRPHLYFVGDSHALDLFPLSEIIFARHVASVTNLYETSCHVPPPSGSNEDCVYPMAFLAELPEAPRGSIIVIRNNYSPRTVEGSLLPYERSIEELVGALLRKHYQVVYFLPAPKYYSLGPGRLCSEQWFRPKWALPAQCSEGFSESRQEQIARRSEFTAYLESLARKTPGFLIFDPFAPLCGDDTKVCRPIRDGRLLYRDESHLTERGSEELAPSFIGFLHDGVGWPAQ
jgi:peptidoglycan/LPS O-acetylase OafA/YrhL